jgi:hypothetical protein
MMDEVEEAIDLRDVLVTLAMQELLGEKSVIDVLVSLGMSDVVEDARELLLMEQEEEIDSDPLDDPEPDDLPDFVEPEGDAEE